MKPFREMRKLLLKSNEVSEFKAKFEINGTSLSMLYDKSSVASDIKL